MMKNKPNFSLVLKGMAMGIAEIIPGVSGGTIAFITGIYKELIETIKSFDFVALKLLFSGNFKAFAEKINVQFLSTLLFGMLGGVVFGVFVITHLLDTNPEILWGFFFGLILASVPMMLSKIKHKDLKVVLVFIVGALIAFGITSLSPAEANTSYFYIFLSGLIAIVALVLPGISGSFILLLLGMYTYIIPTIKSFLSSPNAGDFIVLAIFGMGCLSGLLFFVRLISKAFNNYYNITIAAMSGFMLGSLNKIWPWRNVKSYLDKASGQIVDLAGPKTTFDKETIKVITESNVRPSDYWSDPKTLLVGIAFIFGLMLVLGLFKMDKSKL